jgi:hypothetical protein
MSDRPGLNRYGKPAPAGPWWNEPDQEEWPGPHGLVCRALRGPFGAWCGYVGIPPGQPLYGSDYGDLDLDVHGGLTFAGPHADRPGLWWLGFDCAHAGDHAPGMLLDYAGEVEVYRDLPYVRAELARLAEQIAGLAPVGLLGWVRGS